MAETHQDWASELDLLFGALPPPIRDAARNAMAGRDELLEIVMDLGRQPEARFTDTEVILGADPVA